MRTESLIENLSRDLNAARPVRPLGFVTLSAFFFALTVVAVGLVFFPIREDAGSLISNSSYLFELAIPGFILVISILLVDVFSVPGRAIQLVSPTWIWFALLVLALLPFARSAKTSWVSVVEGMGSVGVLCSMIVALLAALPAFALAFVARRRAVTRPRIVGILLPLAGVAAGILGITLHCPFDNAVHIEVWHIGIPVALGFVVGTLLVPRILRW